MTKKKIDIDLNLFSVAGQIHAAGGKKGTRKNRKTMTLDGSAAADDSPSETNKLNYRSRSSRAKTSKNDLLERIRRHQAEQYKILFDPRHAQKSAAAAAVDDAVAAATLPLLPDTKDLVDKMDAAIGRTPAATTTSTGPSELQMTLGHLERMSTVEQEQARKSKIGGIARTLRQYMPESAFTPDQRAVATKTFFNPLEQWNMTTLDGVDDITNSFGGGAAAANVVVDTPPGVFDAEYMVPTPLTLSKPYSPATPVASTTATPTLPSTQPTYGCLKGGTLPTYRQYYQTQRQHSFPTPTTIPAAMTGGGEGGGTTSLPPPPPPPKLADREKITGRLQTQDESTVLRKLHEKMEEKERLRKKMETKIPALMEKRRKKILKRTFHVGRKKYLGQVGVLLPNRTLRNHVVTKVQKYRQTPMSEIRKFLLKKGFIKVGSTAPNDVLRKLYESLMLIGGEVENHNSENMLFNFFQTAPPSSATGKW